MRAAILGTGLIGASIGQGLRAAGWEVAAWDPAADALVEAGDHGAYDVALPDGTLADAGPLDLVVLAGPPEAVVEAVASLVTGSLVMDVAGVKQPVFAASRLARFVGTHPMAGREVSGPGAASAALFRGAAWVVVADGAAEADVEAVEDVVRLLGARPLRMSAVEHDTAVAAISHLPQVLAAALLQEAAAETGALDLAAGSFRDLTRVAASDPAVWVQLLGANRDAVLAAIAGVRGRLDAVAGALAAGGEESASVLRFLSIARELRLAMAPPVVEVRVALADQPGELAKVGRAFERSAVDVRDLQLRHSPHGGGGVLTISVRHGEGETLRAALVAEGLLVAD
jgi:prephenate dehydrogenase